MARSGTRRGSAATRSRSVREEDVASWVGRSAAPAIAWDAEFRVLAANRAFERATGHGAAGIVGRPLGDLLAEDQRSATMRAIRRTRGRRGMTALEIPIRTRQGQTRWFRWNVAREAEGPRSRKLASVAQGQDVTDLKQAGEALQRTERQMARLLEGSSDGFGEFEAATGCVTITPRYAEIHGLPPGTARISVGELMALVEPEFVPAIQADMAAIEGGARDSHAWEYRIRRPDGARRWIQSRGRVVGRDGKGRPVHVSGAVTDVTTRREAEEELQRLVSELRGALERVRTFPGEVTFCSGCRKVGDDRGRWEDFEAFVERHVGCRIGHGICPACSTRLFPGR